MTDDELRRWRAAAAERTEDWFVWLPGVENTQYFHANTKAAGREIGVVMGTTIFDEAATDADHDDWIRRCTACCDFIRASTPDAIIDLIDEVLRRRGEARDD